MEKDHVSKQSTKYHLREGEHSTPPAQQLITTMA